MHGHESGEGPVRLGEDYFADPHRVHEALRERGPAVEVILPRGLRVWLVTGYDEARTALAYPRFSKDQVRHGELLARHYVGDGEPAEFDRSLVRHMLNSDPPEHTRLRKLVAAAFTPRQVALLEPAVRELTDRLLTEMAGETEVDLVAALAFPLPMQVICDLLDVSGDRRGEFHGWSQDLLANADPAAVGRSSRAMVEFLREQIDRKRADPGPDFFSALVQPAADGDRLSAEELISMAFLLLIAGHETTVNLISSAVRGLLREPTQLARLHAAPELIPAAVEEFLRLDGPVNTATYRFTAEPVDLGGVVIPAGEIVMVSVLAANRDPERYPDPARLDLDRAGRGHLAFGHGIHFCLGAPLARMEARIALGALLERFDLAPAVDLDTLPWQPSTLLHGVQRLPVRLTPRTVDLALDREADRAQPSAASGSAGMVRRS